MDAICVVCKERPCDFDEYICQQCSRDLAITANERRLAYSQLFNMAADYRKAIEMGHSEKEVFHIAPAVSLHNARKLHYFIRLLDSIESVDGNYVECGVAQGQSLLYLASIAFDSIKPRHIWGFDSFTGPEKPTVEDTMSNNNVFVSAVTQDAIYNINSLVSRLSGYGIPPIWLNSNVSIVAGFFEETLGNYDGSPIAFLHLDCNYYKSYKTCLDFFYPLVSRGGIIALDEYLGSYDLLHFPGAKKAIDEFCAETGEKIVLDKKYGKCYIVKGG